MTDPVDRLREALSRQRLPDPGPFFAARVANRVLAEEHRRRERRGAAWFVGALGFILLCGAIALVTAGARTFAGGIGALVLVPAGFGFWTFRREVGREIRGAIELLLG
jgi:hypothetical protein